MLIGELKEIKPARFGHKLVIKHLPEHPFYLNDQTYKRMVKQFDAELLLWRGIESSHLIVIATFRLTAGYAELDNLSLMNVSSQWIPFETADELALIEYLVAEGRLFSKCLRYNPSRTKLLASAVLVDIRMPLALYIARDGAGDESADGIDGLIADSQTASYIWDPKQPGLPFEPQQGKPQIAYAATV